MLILLFIAIQYICSLNAALYEIVSYQELIALILTGIGSKFIDITAVFVDL